jgi:ABC-type methionine transport system ATPase subunit
MAKHRYMFTFLPKLAEQPIIHNLSIQFRLVTNICRANITDDGGWMVLELEGEEKDIEESITWLVSKGVRVEVVAGDVD